MGKWLTFVKMIDFEVEKNILIQFINKSWYRWKPMNKNLIKRIVLYCPTSSHNSSTFYSHIHTYTYTYLSYPIGCHAIQPVGCSLLLYAPRLKDPWPSGTCHCWQVRAEKGEPWCIAWKRRLAANFGLGDSPTPRLVNHETEHRDPC